MEQVGKSAIMGSDIDPRDITLKLFPSRLAVELGERWAIHMRIENCSPHDVWIADLTTTLDLPPELFHMTEELGSTFAEFPTATEPLIGFNHTPLARVYQAVKIPPKGRYFVNWLVETKTWQYSPNMPLTGRLQWHLFFHPGSYQFRAEVHIWSSRPDVEKLSRLKLLEITPSLIGMESDYDRGQDKDANSEEGTRAVADSEKTAQFGAEKEKLPASEAIIAEGFKAAHQQELVLAESLPVCVNGTVEVTPQSYVIFVAAAFGGFLAFFLRELNILSRELIVASWKDLFLLPSYMLTAVVVTLFLSRITEARFPLTIKVMDFWGASALGLISAFGGDFLLMQLISGPLHLQ